MFPAQNNRPLPANQPLYFDDFITRNNWTQTQRQMAMQLSLLPATNVYETETAFFIELVVPGLSHDDLTFFTTDDRIEIRYEPENSDFEPYGSRRSLHREYRLLAFQRVFQLNGEALDLDGLQVRSGAGIVQMEIPKREEHRGVLPLQVPFSLN
ncbi:MAG: Hsp20/alpha crystallin family protein [Lewinellaceae bacterium]|nr:Hsp20/alpha crystallin family protein [Lewinellaceae bacterium]